MSSSSKERDSASTADGEDHREAGHAPPSLGDEESISADAQAGVQRIEAITTVWTRTHLVVAYIMIWFIYFVDTIQQNTTSSLTPYVTSSFNRHSLTATTSIMSSIIGGLMKLPLAKILDIWGRPQGYLLSVVLTTVGLVMMATCKGVETYAAAQVFYWVGYNGLSYTLSIFIADTSALKNRALMFAFSMSPYIITTWIGGPIANAFLAGPGFRWGFGTFTILTPVVTLPLYFLFMYNQGKAKKQGLLPPVIKHESWTAAVKYYAIQFDVVGLLLLMSGLALFLLPFSLYTYQTDGWSSALVVSMIVVGGLLLISFIFWEKYCAPVTFLPYELFSDRTVVGANILAATLFVSFYIWDAYFPSFLQVVTDLSVTQSSYVVNIYSIGSCFWAIVVGVLVRLTGRFKWMAMYFGVPITILGVGLMLHFRQPDVNIGYIVMCQIFIALGGGTLVICEQMAAMAAVPHQYVAVILAIEAMFASIGGAVGLSVAAAVWTGVFPARLMEYLPEESKGNFANIYGDLRVQRSYPVGSPTRDAINRAYGDAQKNMLIGGTAVLAIAIVAVAIWRDIHVKEFKQVKGRVV
jgi:MFS family permease